MAIENREQRSRPPVEDLLGPTSRSGARLEPNLPLGRMKGHGLYDKELQMFREAATEPNLAKLRFLRWLVEHDKLEHQAAGQSGGEFATEELVAPQTLTGPKGRL